MNDGVLQSDIFENPRKILSDVQLIASQRSRISDEVMEALVRRAAAVVEEVEPGSREFDRIARFLQRERKLEDAEKRTRLEIAKILLGVMSPHVATAVQVNIDTKQAHDSENHDDFVARKLAELDAILGVAGEGGGPDGAGDSLQSGNGQATGPAESA